MLKRSRIIRVAIAGAIVAVALAAVSSAGAYDRTPVRVSGLTPDSWGWATTSAQRALHNRYPGVSSDYCLGVVMIGHEAVSSWVHGTTRYWDKLYCGGYTQSGKFFSAVLDPKGGSGWNLYRLRGATIGELAA
jgi:hypothetical protein